jgi:hypothetical protein
MAMIREYTQSEAIPRLARAVPARIAHLPHTSPKRQL